MVDSVYENVEEVQAHQIEYIQKDAWPENESGFEFLVLIYNTDDGVTEVYADDIVLDGEGKTVYSKDSSGGIPGPYIARTFDVPQTILVDDGEVTNTR